VDLFSFNYQAAALILLCLTSVCAAIMGETPMSFTIGEMRQKLREAVTAYKIRRLIRQSLAFERKVMAEITLIETRMSADGEKLRFLAHRMKSLACVTNLAKDYGLASKDSAPCTAQRAKLSSLA
jgi:hypothetical protein